MGCGCGANQNGQTYTYVYTSPTGSTTTYRSEIEARAAIIRNGGGTFSAVPK